MGGIVKRNMKDPKTIKKEAFKNAELMMEEEERNIRTVEQVKQSILSKCNKLADEIEKNATK